MPITTTNAAECRLTGCKRNVVRTLQSISVRHIGSLMCHFLREFADKGEFVSLRLKHNFSATCLGMVLGLLAGRLRGEDPTRTITIGCVCSPLPVFTLSACCDGRCYRDSVSAQQRRTGPKIPFHSVLLPFKPSTGCGCGRAVGAAQHPADPIRRRGLQHEVLSVTHV